MWPRVRTTTIRDLQCFEDAFVVREWLSALRSISVYVVVHSGVHAVLLVHSLRRWAHPTVRTSPRWERYRRRREAVQDRRPNGGRWWVPGVASWAFLVLPTLTFLFPASHDVR